MGNIKEINIKSHTYYFFNDIINIKNFDSSLPKRDKKSFENIDIYSIRYIETKKVDDYENIYSVNPLCLMSKEDRYIEQKDGNEYLIFGSTDENKEVLKKYTELWDGIKNEILTKKWR